MVTCQSSELGWEVTVELPTDFLSLGRGSVSTSVTWVGTSLISAPALLCATTPQYCTVPSGTYCAVSYSFLITGLGSKTII